MRNLSQISERLDRIIKDQIARDELQQLGHRIIFDVKTGWSKNVSGIRANVEDIDPGTGYKIR